MSNSEPIYKCPACGEPLCMSEDKDNAVVAVWCGVGKCQSKVLGDGAEGGSIEEAVEALYFMWKESNEH